VRLEVELIRARMRAPVVSARGSVGTRELLLVTLSASDGVCGVGEAAPLESYDGVGIEEVVGALSDCREALASSDGFDREELVAECRRIARLPQAVAAIDLALWDLAARRAGAPVWRLLGAVGGEVEVNATVAAADRAGAATEAAAARAAGFRCLKAKVAIGDDAGRLAAIRAAVGPDMEIRLDANGAWSVEETLASLRVLEPVGIELCEEPVAGLDAIARVSASTLVPIAIDETAGAPGAFDRRLCDAVCLKIARCGGISGVIEAARRARAVGYEIYLASTHDGPLGIAAALHAAALIKPDRPSGLATLSLFDRPDPLPARAGRIEVPQGAGLGDGLDAWYASARSIPGI
jgi:L-alanine-DL-glutamate epimerase-like enolase superfamily enzyme